MKKILVIEDNEMNQDLILRRLKKKGYEVTLAGDGEEGLRLIKEIKPSLVLVDVNLPKMDGWEVARASKDDPETKDIPLIALTAHAMEQDKRKALDAGCDDYETKPIEFKQLISKIEKFVA